MKARAAVLVAPGNPLEIQELDIPPPGLGQVLVRVAWAGLCRTQLDEARGRRGPDPYLPHAMGHEGSGVVLEAGEGVKKVRPGQQVVLTWIKGLGRDVPGSVYGGPHGPVNGGGVTTFMEAALVSENRTVPLPPGVALREAALLGCAVPTGAGMVRNTGRIEAGQSVAVFGVGGVGLCAVMAAKAAGAAPIVAVDVDQARLARARKLGATHGVSARDGNPADAIREITGGRGVDLAVEAAGVAADAEAALASTRDAGGLCVLAGNPPPGTLVAVDPYLLIRGRRLVGSWGGDTDPDRDLPRYAADAAAGRMDLAALITHVYPLDDINRALEDLEQGRVGRAVIEVGGSAPTTASY